MADWAVIFDLDGVLTDTAELHYQSWQALADELGLPFDRAANEALRGLSREQSLALVLGPRGGEFSEARRAELTRRKNDDYLRRVATMTPDDLLDGAADLLVALTGMRIPLAVASSSRNARTVIERLGVASRFAVIVDGNEAPLSKPDPQVFRLAAERLRMPPARCIVIEDAASGVAAGRAAGMRVIGLGPRDRVGHADRVVTSLCDLDPAQLCELLPA